MTKDKSDYVELVELYMLGVQYECLELKDKVIDQPLDMVDEPG